MARSEVTAEGRLAAMTGLVDLRRRLAGLRLGQHLAAQRIAFTAFGIRIASGAIMFASQALIARWLGSSQFGTFVYVWTWLLVAGDLVHLGLPLTAQRFVPEYKHAQSSELLRGYLSGSRWLTFATGSAAALVAALVVHSTASHFESSLVTLFYLACAALPAYGLTFMSDGLARSYNWIGLALLPAYVLRPVILIAAVAGLHAAGVTLDAITVMSILAGAAWLSALVQVLQFNRRLKAAVAAGAKRYDLRRWLATALPMILVWGLYALLTSTDVLVLKQFRPPEEVAHYYAAAKSVALVSFIYFAVAATSAHRFTTYHVAGDHGGLARLATSSVRWVFWPSLALSVPLIVFGHTILGLFGPDFVAGYPVMVILAIGQLARASIGPAERVVNMLGQQRRCAFAYAVAFAFNIAACLLLAPVYGAIGAAMATAGAFVIESALLYMIARRGLGLHMFVWDWHKGVSLKQDKTGNAAVAPIEIN